MEEETLEQPENQEQFQPAESDTVALHEATIEDIDAEISRQKGLEDEAESDGVSSEPGNFPEFNEPIPPGNSAGAQVPTEASPVGATSSNPQRVYTEAEIQEIIAASERERTKGNQKELFIQHRGNELGALRTQLAQTKGQLTSVMRQLEAGLNDKYAENPAEAVRDQKRIDDLAGEIGGLESQEWRAINLVEAQTYLVRHVDIDRVSPDDIADMLRADGTPEDYVQSFKSNPLEWAPKEALVQMAKRAIDRKEYVQADTDRRLLAKYVVNLEGQIQQLRGRPGQVMRQVQRNLNQPAPVTSASSATPKSSRELDPTRMSIAELDAALRQAGMH